MHRRTTAAAWTAAAAAILAGCLGSVPVDDTEGAPHAVPPGDGVGLTLVADGFQRPLLATHAGDGSGDLYVVEQDGRVWRLPGGEPQGGHVFLDLSDRVATQGWEQGLLGLAFHPRFADNGAVVASYTAAGSGDSVLERFILAPGADALDPGAGEELLRVLQPFANHNGGHMAYGPDGYLYFGLGDGGAAGDPTNQSQNRLTLLGSMLRLDVGPEGPYEVPADNPFAGDPSGADEVWSYGLRNPWRFSFDRATGDLWTADVGQSAWEEVNLQPASSRGGENHGWNLFEGNHHYPTGVPAPPGGVAGLVFPVHVYPNTGNDCSVTGGYVARDAGVPALEGHYVFGDYCSGTVWALGETDGAWEAETVLETGFRISSFGEDEEGRLYVLDHEGGAVHRFVAQ